MKHGRNPKQVPRHFGRTPSENVRLLGELFRYAAAWGTPAFKALPKEDREEFRDMVKVGDLYATARNFGIVCLQLGVQLSDRVLDGVLELVRVQGAARLPEAVRTRFTCLSLELWRLRFRLEAEEVVIYSDDFPEPLVGGRWAPKKDGHEAELSIPDSKTGIAQTFGISVGALNSWVKNGTVKLVKKSRQRWQVDLRGLSPEARAKFGPPSRLRLSPA